MTRSRDDRSAGRGASDVEGRAGAERDGELESAFADASNDDADGDGDGPALLPSLDAEAGPARLLSAEELLVLADRIERQFLAQRARPRRLSPRRLLLAAGLFAASAAAAVYGVGVVRRAVAPASVKPAPTWSRPALLAPGAASGGAAPATEQPREAAPELVAPSEFGSDPKQPEEAPDHDVAERPTEPSLPTPRGVSSTAPETIDSAPSVASQSARVSRSGASTHQNNPANAVAADRLAAANSLRSQHRYREALALYLRVIEMDPRGMPASVARVAAAEMQLEQLGDIAGAERLYREARTQGGELTAEAQFGLAQVARARGDAPGEQRALQEFLGRHPESPLAAAARRRLNTLGPK